MSRHFLTVGIATRLAFCLSYSFRIYLKVYWYLLSDIYLQKTDNRQGYYYYISKPWLKKTGKY